MPTYLFLSPTFVLMSSLHSMLRGHRDLDLWKDVREKNSTKNTIVSFGFEPQKYESRKVERDSAATQHHDALKVKIGTSLNHATEYIDLKGRDEVVLWSS